MRLRLLPVVASIAVVLLAGVSCSDATAPSTSKLDGSYIAVALNGAPLPAKITWGASLPDIVVADTLRFDGRGQGMNSLTLRDTISGQLTQTSESFGYRVDGTSVHFYYSCPPGDACSALSGTLTVGDWLVVGSEPVQFLYRRLH